MPFNVSVAAVLVRQEEKDMNGRTERMGKRGKRVEEIRARVPAPNGNVTVAMGHKALVDAVFRDTGLGGFLDGLKRDQGDSVAMEVAALVACSAEMTGVSVSRLDRMLGDGDARREYGLSGDPRSIYRTVERIGRNSDAIVGFLGVAAKDVYGAGLETTFLDWTSIYFEADPKGPITFGHTRDHRPDRPQVTVGLAMDKGSGMPVGLTVMPGNTVDVTHFEETLMQVRPLLPEGAMAVFDNGGYSMGNAALLDKEGIGFLTRMQLNASDDKHVAACTHGWRWLDDDVSFMVVKGNLGRRRFLFRSERLRAAALARHLRKAERDYDEMTELKAALEKGKRPRKKHRNSNCFVDTRLSHRFPLDVMTREEAIAHAAKEMATGREGMFVLLTSRPLSAQGALGLYRSRNAAESAFRDLKHGIDWRPARCTSIDAVRGRVLVSFLALFCMSMVRFLYPEFRAKTAESISEELSSFSLTVEKGADGSKRRIWSNFTPIIRRIWGGKRRVPAPRMPEAAPKGPVQASMDGFG